MQENALRLLDFTTVDTLLQVHDYDGLGMSSRDANSKKAAADASKIFQDYYPETLVGCTSPLPYFFDRRPSYFCSIGSSSSECQRS